ncbi:MAG: hypothetical protein PHD81_04325 [Candidatus Nanoarchaeia archaeon]|nr:hypothetical protein [Candidatus Nanoarchaeia archaeon]MDD5588304.1 hypothetical protein [Candidatus Nanoarchaeia archaeon]
MNKKIKRIINIMIGLLLVGYTFTAGYSFYTNFKKRELKKELIRNLGTIEKPTYFIQESFVPLKDFSLFKKDEIIIAKETFNLLTGKEFPKAVDFEKINENPIKLGWVGRYYQDQLKIKYVDSGKGKNLDTLVHEMGHMMVQHDEIPLENIFSLYDELSYNFEKAEDIFKLGKNKRVLEEAAAYAYTNAVFDYLLKQGVSQEKNKEISEGFQEIFEAKLFFKIEMESRTNTFYIKGNNEEHYKGAALFYATEKVIKNPYNTFNYLATLKDSDLNNLDYRIKEQMIHDEIFFLEENVRSLYKEIFKMEIKLKEKNDR